jgi:hypothetical protein
MPENSRVFKPKTSLRLIIGVAVGGIFLLAFIFFATWSSMHEINEAKMTGVVMSKKFTPAAEQLISMGKGGFVSQNKKGNFSITVDVAQKSGPPKEYIVDNLGEEDYNKLKVGDKFDVGPYLIQ